MAKILIPIDGSEPALRALQWAIDQIRQGARHSIALLNIQPEILTGHARAYFSKADLDAYMEEEAREALGPAEKMLADAGIPFESSYDRGYAPTVIAEHVEQDNIEQIVMGTRGLNRFSGLLLGSVATGVLNLVKVPVTLIK